MVVAEGFCAEGPSWPLQARPQREPQCPESPNQGLRPALSLGGNEPGARAGLVHPTPGNSLSTYGGPGVTIPTPVTALLLS